MTHRSYEVVNICHFWLLSSRITCYAIIDNTSVCVLRFREHILFDFELYTSTTGKILKKNFKWINAIWIFTSKPYQYIWGIQTSNILKIFSNLVHYIFSFKTEHKVFQSCKCIVNQHLNMHIQGHICNFTKIKLGKCSECFSLGSYF